MPRKKPEVLYQHDFKPKSDVPLDRRYNPASVRLPPELAEYVFSLPKGTRNEWLIAAVADKVAKDRSLEINDPRLDD